MQINLSEGDVFHGRYRIIRQIGKGGAGSVYLASQIDVKRQVALKLIDQASQNNDNMERFLREFKLLASLEHSGIVTFYSAAISAEGIPYAVCEYIKGRNLQELISEKVRIPWQELAKIAIQICHALEYAHANSIVHRDLKPANIMLMDYPEANTVKIIDFGLGKIMQESSEKLTGTGLLMGTPHYMSPEQAVGGKVDGRSDIYALACIIFEAVSGRKLFDAHSPIGILHKHVNENPEITLEVIIGSRSEKLQKILLKMLAKDPDKRYPDMKSLSADLEKIANDKIDGFNQIPDELFASSKQTNFPALRLIALATTLLAAITLSLILWQNYQRSQKLSEIRNFQFNATAIPKNELKKERGREIEIDRKTANSKAKRIRMLQDQIDRYDDSLKLEKDPERRKQIIWYQLARGKELLYEIRFLRLSSEDEEKAIANMLKHLPEMDDSSMIHSDLLRSLALIKEDKGDYKAAHELCNKGLSLLEGKDDETPAYVFRLLASRARLEIKEHELEKAEKTTASFKKFGGMPRRDTNLPVYSRFPSVPSVYNGIMGSEIEAVMNSFDDLEIRSLEEKLLKASIYGNLAEALIADHEGQGAGQILRKSHLVLTQLQRTQKMDQKTQNELDSLLSRTKALENAANSRN